MQAQAESLFTVFVVCLTHPTTASHPFGYSPEVETRRLRSPARKRLRMRACSCSSKRSKREQWPVKGCQCTGHSSDSMPAGTPSRLT